MYEYDQVISDLRKLTPVQLNERLPFIQLNVLKKIIHIADNEYYNGGDVIFSDETYDTIREYVQKKDKGFEKVGAPVNNGSTTTLPFWMGSMNKLKEHIYTEKEVVISDKLDGVSCLYHFKNGNVQLFTRGNGKVGQNITHLLKDIVFNENLSIGDHTLRGELIMKDIVFEDIQNELKASNARNTVSGFVNSKSPNKLLKGKIEFVPYEVLIPKGVDHQVMSPKSQFEFLKSNGFNYVDYFISKGTATEELKSYLKERKNSSPYSIDGIIVATNEEYNIVPNKNPKHAFAFKELTSEIESAVTTIEKIEWKLSKDGYLKPTVVLTPVLIQNVRISRTSGFNAKYIKDNKLGRGSIVTIVRSGDVIPYIQNILESTEAEMPKKDFIWNNTGTDIMLKPVTDNEYDELKQKQFEYMLTTLNFKGLGKTNIKKLFDSGIRSIRDVFELTTDRLMTMDGFSLKSSTKLIDEIKQKKSNLKCIDYMVASNIFERGFAEKTLKKILHKYSMDDNPPSVSQLTTIDGISNTKAQQYLTKLPLFLKFIQENNLHDCIRTRLKVSNANANVNRKANTNANANSNVNRNANANANSNVNRNANANANSNVNRNANANANFSKRNSKTPLLNDQIIVFTGFRDKLLDEFIEDNGGKTSATISKNTTMVIYKESNREKSKTKIQQAITKNIPLIELNDFKLKYNVTF